jgi:hypothetical protein
LEAIADITVQHSFVAEKDGESFPRFQTQEDYNALKDDDKSSPATFFFCKPSRKS